MPGWQEGQRGQAGEGLCRLTAVGRVLRAAGGLSCWGRAGACPALLSSRGSRRLVAGSESSNQIAVGARALWPAGLQESSQE